MAVLDDMVKQAGKQGRQLDAAMQGFARVMKRLRYGR